MNSVLVTGLTALDIVYECDEHPKEGCHVQSNSEVWRKGGNAANTEHVLGQLNVKVDLMSVLADNHIGNFVATSLQKYCVGLQHCVYITSHKGLFPTSICILSKNTGSRSVIHCRNNFPPLTLDLFQKNISCNKYKWFHFEERCCAELFDVLIHVRSQNAEATISIEIEKPKRFETVTKRLLPLADVIFLSKEMAKALGYGTPSETVSKVKVDLRLKDDQIVVCPWGDRGAAAVDKGGSLYESNAFIPERVVDSLGAGDTFIAGVIFCLNNGKSLEEAIIYGCKIAGNKCGMLGFDNILPQS